jgi:nucleoside-diphosphate-sugar epimerase
VTFLLTGASGFVGGHVARQLAAAGHRLRAVVRRPDAAGALRALGIELFQGDVAVKDTLRAPMTGVDGVFHIAGWYKIGVPARDEAIAANVAGTRHVLELMEELQVPRGVYTSTLAVNSDTHGQVVDERYRFHGRHISLYDETKAQAHELADAFIARGLPLIIVQPGLVYGPGDTSSVGTTLVQYLRRRLPLVPKQTAFAWGYVDDVARGHVAAMERGQPGQNYFLCGPVHTLEEALAIAEEITGIPAPRLRASPGLLRAMAAATAVVEKVVPVPAAYTAESLRVVAGVTYLGSNERAKRELGWTPRPLREGLAETLRYEMARLGMSPLR